jgi:hypothetical protein
MGRPLGSRHPRLAGRCGRGQGGAKFCVIDVYQTFFFFSCFSCLYHFLTIPPQAVTTAVPFQPRLVASLSTALLRTAHPPLRVELLRVSALFAPRELFPDAWEIDSDSDTESSDDDSDGDSGSDSYDSSGDTGEGSGAGSEQGPTDAERRLGRVVDLASAEPSSDRPWVNVDTAVESILALHEAVGAGWVDALLPTKMYAFCGIGIVNG